jgi:glycosyltransferase involved in cell wall biosynthesis
MKKILVIHNRYQNIGGEDVAVENEVEVLNKYFEVETLYFKNDNLITPHQIKSFVTNRNSKSIDIVKNKIKSFDPDIVYVHNTWFKASLGILDLLSDMNIKTLIKVHNFRYHCTGTFSGLKHLDGNEFCNACGYKPKFFNFFNKYFSESFFKSVLVLIYGKKYLKIIKSKKINLLVLTEFHKNYIRKIGGFNSSIYVHPNPINLLLKRINEEKENTILYAGRVSHEKGVDKLIESFINARLEEITLKIAGEGPLLNELKKKYENNPEVIFLGVLKNIEVIELINKSIAIVSATRLYEGQPTLLCEASIMGVPSIFPKSGGISEFFPKNYLLSYNQFDYKDLEEKLRFISEKSKLEVIGLENKDYIFNYLNEKKLIDSFNIIIDG